MRRAGAVAVTAALGAVFAVAGTAHAGDDTHNGCAPGYVCAFNGTNLTDGIDKRTAGTWSGTSGDVRSMLNNGMQDVGADHIRYAGWVNYGDGTYRSVKGCLHFDENASGLTSGSWTNFPATTRINSAKWGGECSSGERPMELGPKVYLR
ncbi:hypothetical protein ACFU9F_20110 [Streptomyces zhihengii]|uniref:Peptidase inhibitor family I36 n=2 Tax=Streptomyces zhihengii TaxID=1818004 RepID=A0ABS2URW1_9ACTN|nr:hypothetical protein [Streptomyces zhihengii]